MENEPFEEEYIFKKLKEFKSKDLSYSSGRILGSMCSEPHPLSKKVYMDFLDSNLGDHGLFEGTKAIEYEVINIIASFLSLDNPYGKVVTGGTEANIMAMRSARNLYKEINKIKNQFIKPFEVIIPKSAHFSFKKASDMLGFKLVEIDLDDEYKMDIEYVKENINKNTIAIVGVAGTTELGMIDPIEELSQISIDKNIYFHVDAAFGGFSIPFLNDIGYNLPNFDFSNDGVSSITIDPHKMGLTAIPAGCIIYRKKDYLDLISVDSPYLTSKKQSTIVGTRSGAASAATWAMLKYMGKKGYRELANSCMINTNFLADALFKEGFNLVTKPQLNIVGFNHPKIEIDDLIKAIEYKSWKVSTTTYPKAVRIVIMPHIKHTHIMEFIKDLKEVKKEFINTN
ncbi:MAG: tyrosine decarboxylase MfnA [Methanobrevibacter sp.]|nr:tyrosine decarboxylase MfnA [Candidatus Methanovirga basalitermitum]